MFIRRDTIKRLRHHLESGNLLNTSIRMAGIRSTQTLHAWKLKSNCNRLGRLIELSMLRGQQLRDDNVEEAQYNRLVRGIASGFEYQFYLTNRRTDRWKKVDEYRGHQGAPVLLKPPIINYISVSVTNGKTEVSTQENGNGNGRHLDHV
jgi:hypothetical protein